jgi:hypothetical protein
MQIGGLCFAAMCEAPLIALSVLSEVEVSKGFLLPVLSEVEIRVGLKEVFVPGIGNAMKLRWQLAPPTGGVALLY